MKRICTLFLIVLISVFAQAQNGKPVIIDSCYAWARLNYPMLKQYDVIRQTKDFTVQNAWRGYIPQINASGQATYQSEVVNFKDVFGSLPLPPGIKFPSYSKDQYRLTGEVYQTIFDAQQSKFKKE